MPPKIFRALIPLTLWPALATPVRGQQVSSALSPQIVGTGQAAEYSITYEGSQAPFESVPEIRVPGLEVLGPGSQASLSSVNGVTTYRRELTWQLIAARAGRYVIPPLTIGIAGQSFTTSEQVLEVREGALPSVSLEPFLRVNVGKKELFVGEVTPLAITAFVHRRTQLRNYDHPKLPRENFVVKRFPQPMPGASVEMNGERYQPIQFSSALSAIREGDLPLGPATLDCTVDFPASAQDVRNTPQGIPPSFFQRMVTRQFSLRGEPVTITVKPLPVEGRPPDFAGSVGRFALVTRASQSLQQIHVGDPISLDLYVTGQGNFDSVTPPTPDPAEGWKLYPAKVSQENRATGLDPGTQVYNQVIVPQRMVTAIPAFQFSYFDPDQRKYLTARSAPIPLMMLPEEPRSNPRSGEAPTKDFSVAEAIIPEERLADILTARPAGSPLVPLVVPARDEALTWALQGIPAAIVLALIGVGLQRRSREKSAADQLARAAHPRTLAEIRRDMKRSGLNRKEFYALGQEYATSARFHRGAHAAPPIPGDSFDLVLTRQAYYSYSGDEVEGAAPVSAPEQKEVLAALEHAGR